MFRRKSLKWKLILCKYQSAVKEKTKCKSNRTPFLKAKKGFGITITLFFKVLPEISRTFILVRYPANVTE